MALEVTVAERCLLYLLDRVGIAKSDPASEQLVQDRIAEVIGARRPHVSRALNQLARAGHVDIEKVHVRGKNRRVLGYFLTPNGVRKAGGIKRLVEEKKVTVVDLEGNEKRLRLFEARSLLARKPRLLQLAMGVQDGRIDLRRFLNLDKRMQGGMMYDVEEVISVPHFSGREDTLARLDGFMKEPSRRGFLLVGLPGVGKTALASKWVAGVKGQMHVLWRRVQPGRTASDTLRDLARVLNAAGRPALMESLQQPAQDWRARSVELLKRDLRGIVVLLVLDNAHLASEDLGTLVSEILAIEPANASIKVILLGRERCQFIRAEDIARGRVLQEELPDLSQSEAERMMAALEVDRARRGRIWEVCGGHPLSIELAAEGGVSVDAVKETSASRLAQEVLSRLDPRLREALVFASVFEGSIPLSLLGGHGRELVRLCLLRDAGNGRASMHDLVRAATVRGASSQELGAFHRRAGEFLASSKEPGEALEAARHFVESEAYPEAEILVSTRGQEFIDAGLAEMLLSTLEKLAWTSKTTKREPPLSLLRAQALFALGRWAAASKAYELCSGFRDGRIAAEALLGQGKAEVQRHSPLAGNHLKRAKQRLERLGALRLLVEAEYWVGGQLEETGRIDGAREAYERGRAVAIQVGDRRWEGLCTYGIGGILSLKKDYAGAAEEDEEALRLLERDGQRLEIAKVCSGLGGELMELGRYEESEKYLMRAIAESRATGAVGVLASALFNLAGLRNELGRGDEAIPLFTEALSEFDAQDKSYEAALCAAWLASYSWMAGHEEIGNEYARRARRLLSRTLEPALRVRALRTFARAALKAGNKVTARKHLREALAAARKAHLGRGGSDLTAELDKLG